MLSATGVDVFADWVEFADKVEFDDNVEFGEVELEGSKVGTIEAAVAVELLSEDALAVKHQQRKQFPYIEFFGTLLNPYLSD